MSRQSRSIRLSLSAVFSVVVACMWSTSALDALARVQRMVFAPQSHSIPAGRTATAEAFCLDPTGKTPTRGSVFKSAPGEVGQMSVEVGGRKISVQDAINQHLVAIEGTGSPSGLTLRNLSKSEVRFTVEKPSAILPDSSYSSSDLRPAIDALASKELSLEQVWETRAIEQAKALGFRGDKVEGLAVAVETGGQTFHINVPEMDQYQAAVSPKGGKAPPAFLVQRVESDDERGRPLYVLYTGRENPKQFHGNDKLGELASHAITSWKSTGAASSPRLTFVGDGTQGDFDAAALTIVNRPGFSGDLRVWVRPPSAADPLIDDTWPRIRLVARCQSARGAADC